MWRFLIGLFTTMAVVGLIGLTVQSLNADAPELVRQFRVGAVSTLCLHAAVFGLVAWFLQTNGLSLNTAFGLAEPGQLRAAALGVGVVLLFLPVAFGLNWAYLWIAEQRSLAVEPQPAVKLLGEAQGSWQLAVLGVQTLITAPLVEEVLFRGLLYVTVKQAGYPRGAMWGVALLFGLSHGHWPTLLPLTLFGLVLAWLYERTNNLLAPVAAHAGFNAVNFILLVMDR